MQKVVLLKFIDYVIYTLVQVVEWEAYQEIGDLVKTKQHIFFGMTFDV